MPSQLDYTYMQRLIRDVIPDAFEKFYTETSIKTWSSLVQEDILQAAFALMDLITAQLKVCAARALDSAPRRLGKASYNQMYRAFALHL